MKNDKQDKVFRLDVILTLVSVAIIVFVWGMSVNGYAKEIPITVTVLGCIGFGLFIVSRIMHIWKGGKK